MAESRIALTSAFFQSFDFLTQHLFDEFFFSVRQNIHARRSSQLAREDAFKGEGVQVRHMQQILSPGRRGEAARAATDSLAQCGPIEWEAVTFPHSNQETVQSTK